MGNLRLTCYFVLSYILTIAYVTAAPTPIDKQLFVKKKFNNLVLQEDEVIRYNTKNYISGSFLKFNGRMTNMITNQTRDLDGDLMRLVEPYEELTSVQFTRTEAYTNPLHDSATILTTQGADSMKRTFLFFISECYRIIILDFTKRKNNVITTVYDRDLLAIIFTDIGKYHPNELYCNELTSFVTNQLYALPCFGRQHKFFVWFSFKNKGATIDVEIFARHVQSTEVDIIGRNSMIAFVQGDNAWVMSSSVHSRDTFTVTIFDLSAMRLKYIKETYVGTFDRTDFTYGDGTMLPFDFNIRDIRIYSVIADKDADSTSKPQEKVHNIIASCFNNGVLFFQVSQKTTQDLSALLERNPFQKFNLKDMLLKVSERPNFDFLTLTHAINLTQAARLFSFNDFFSFQNSAPYEIFVTHASPASIFEININEHFNPRVIRCYKVAEESTSKFIGRDVISVTRKYIAHLMMDLSDMVEVVRIYYRNESNFAYGHSDIKLRKFVVRVSTIHFLDPDDHSSFFVKNPFFGQLYSINELDFVIDTKNFRNRYQEYINQTYLVNITAFNQERKVESIWTTFRLTFAGRKDMNSYFVGNHDSYLFGHSFGDPSFAKIVSDFFYGPDLKFNLIFKNTTGDRTDLVLPVVTSTHTISETGKLHGKNNCTASFFNRFLNRTTQVENIAFYCIHPHSIEKHIFDTRKIGEINYNVIDYPKSNFIDFAVILDTQSLYGSNDELIMLSAEDDGTYMLHYFDVRDELVTWRSSYKLQLNGYRLRSEDPLIDFDSGSYLVLIDERETRLFFASRSGIVEDTISLSKRVRNLDMFGDLLFVNYYESKEVPVIKISRFINGDKEEISSELLNTFYFNNTIREFSTMESENMVIFSASRQIEIWRIRSAFTVDYVRVLPFFKYEDVMEFYVSEEDNRIVQARFDRFLYVIMINRKDPTDKKLFCYNMLRTSHDSLYSVIKLDKKYADLSNRIFIESNMFSSTVYIYLFYGGRRHQLIKFEPENLMTQINKTEGELFLPFNNGVQSTYPPKDVRMTMYPIYEDFVPTQNKSIDLVISCRNHGLKIESRVPSNNLSFQNREGEMLLALTDHFDGFNNTFEISYDNPRKERLLTYEFNEDSKTRHLLEAVNSTQTVIFSMMYDDYVLVFYENNGLLQLYDTFNGVITVGKNLNYNKIFGGCKIDFIKYSYVADTGETFLIVNCRNFTSTISPAYQYKVFHIDVVNSQEFEVTQVLIDYHNARVKDAKLQKSPKDRNLYVLVMILDNQVEQDTEIYQVMLNCTTIKTCRPVHDFTFNGLTFGYDNFRVNSFVFVRGSPFAMLAVDGFGFVIYDFHAYQVVETIPLENSLFDIPPRTLVMKRVTELGSKGIRVFLRNEGQFSLYWDSVNQDRMRDRVLNGIVIRDRFEAIKGEIGTNLIMPTMNGYVQTIYYSTGTNVKDVYIRLFNYFNPRLTKNFREYKIDAVGGDCIALDSSTHSSSQHIKIALV